MAMYKPNDPLATTPLRGCHELAGSRAVRADFSDLPDAGQAASLLIRLLMTALLGGALGYERRRAGKSAGIRTHMLVSLGTALFVLIPQQAGAAPGDITRVLQGVVAGIGFLGAGTILKDDDRGEVRGLTTGWPACG
jgi:putative Mg2+ transporter-C (MgtC) family protein